jgi:hypothetical protein
VGLNDSQGEETQSEAPGNRQLTWELEKRRIFDSVLMEEFEATFKGNIRVEPQKSSFRISTDPFAVTHAAMVNRGLDYLLLTIKAIMLQGVEDMQRGQKTGAYFLLQCAVWNPAHQRVTPSSDGGLRLWTESGNLADTQVQSQLEHFIINIPEHQPQVNADQDADKLKGFIDKSPLINDLSNIVNLLKYVLDSSLDKDTSLYLQIKGAHERKPTTDLDRRLQKVAELQEPLKECKAALHQQLGHVVWTEVLRRISQGQKDELQRLLGKGLLSDIEDVLARWEEDLSEAGLLEEEKVRVDNHFRERRFGEAEQCLAECSERLAAAEGSHEQSATPINLRRHQERVATTTKTLCQILLAEVMKLLDNISRLRDCLAHHSNNRSAAYFKFQSVASALCDLTLLKKGLLLVFCSGVQVVGEALTKAAPLLDGLEALCPASHALNGNYETFRLRQRELLTAEKLKVGGVGSNAGKSLPDISSETRLLLSALRRHWSILTEGEKGVIRSLTSVLRYVPRAAVVQKRVQATAVTASSKPIAAFWGEEEKEQEGGGREGSIDDARRGA